MAQSARAVLRLGCSVLCFAAMAGVWETLASQAPGSPLYIGMLPGPVELLRDAAVTWGVLIVLAGLLLGDQLLTTRWLWVLRVGAALTMAAGLYAAATGMHGVQARDLRADATWLFSLKYLGRGLLTLGLGAVARRVLGQASP
jgi:hypothetical protein